MGHFRVLFVGLEQLCDKGSYRWNIWVLISLVRRSLWRDARFSWPPVSYHQKLSSLQQILTYHAKYVKLILESSVTKMWILFPIESKSLVNGICIIIWYRCPMVFFLFCPIIGYLWFASYLWLSDSPIYSVFLSTYRKKTKTNRRAQRLALANSLARH